jgi:hypothetical protein
MLQEGLEQLAQHPELSAHVARIVQRSGQDEGSFEGDEHVIGQGPGVDGLGWLAEGSGFWVDGPGRVP